jgi:hypothetical protein
MTTRENRRHEWTARITDYKASGLTMAAWCAANDFSKEQLKYWIRKMKDVPSSTVPTPSVRWVPLSVTDPAPAVTTSSIVVCVGQAKIELHAGFDPGLLHGCACGRGRRRSVSYGAWRGRTWPDDLAADALMPILHNYKTNGLQ